MSTETKRSRPADEEGVAISTLLLAFAADPPIRWLYPKAHDYVTYFPQFVRAFGGAAFVHGSAYQIGECAGVALWLPPGAQPDEESLTALIEATVAPAQLPHVFSLLEQMAIFHPTDSHWYLPMIGVEPAQQGKGYGGTMLRDALLRVDADHLPAYLESTNPANIPLYKRHGFELTGTIEVETAPPMFPMFRQAR